MSKLVGARVAVVRQIGGLTGAILPRRPMLVRKFTPAEVAILETFVIPRYLTNFGELVLDMFLASDVARIVHLGCRTGYPDRQLVEMVDNCSIVGVDSSLGAVELARNKAATLHDVAIEYLVATEYPTELDAQSFSHALALHPIGTASDRLELFREMQRLLYAGGQALVALPLRGSFQEVGDLFREYALKHDHGEFGKAAELAMLEMPTIESLTDELEEAGFEDVDFELRQAMLKFDSGSAFIQDPVMRYFILPEVQSLMSVKDLGEPLTYVGDAIDKYWANRQFELVVKIGAASARKP